MAIHLRLLHGHRLRPQPGRPESKIQTGRLDFGSWILDLGCWIWDPISDFGFWIGLVFVLFVVAPNGAVWISDVGFWSLGFGVLILEFGFGLPDYVWILHKIFPCHADSGRRIFFGISVSLLILQRVTMALPL